MWKVRLTGIFIAALIILAIGGFFYLQKSVTDSPKTIKIGWPSPITGALSSFGEPDPWLAAKITQIVNDQQGGIYLKQFNRKVPVEIMIRDTRSDEKFAGDAAEDLILNEKVDLIVVLHTPSTTVPVTAVCEKYQVPCVAFDTPVLSWLVNAPYKWSFLHFWTEPDVAEAHIGMWDLMKGSTNMKAGGLWNDDSDGRTFRDVITTVAKEHGYDFVGDEGLVKYDEADYSAYISDLKRKNVEIFAMTFIPPDFVRFWQQSYNLDFHPKIATIAKSILFPSSVEDLSGNSPQGLTTEIWWSKKNISVSPLTGFTPEKLADLWEAESGRQWTQPLFYSLGALETALDSVKRAGNLDKIKIRDAVADTDLETIVGRVCFKKPLSDEDKIRYSRWPKLIQFKSNYSQAPVVGGQWMKGTDWPWEIQTVYNWRYQDIPETAKMVLITK
jgi:branched-chain amino acid transport system substrate-binding protein